MLYNVESIMEDQCFQEAMNKENMSLTSDPLLILVAKGEKGETQKHVALLWVAVMFLHNVLISIYVVATLFATMFLTLSPMFRKGNRESAFYAGLVSSCKEASSRIIQKD